jgi:hypothetical protein
MALLRPPRRHLPGRFPGFSTRLHGLESRRSSPSRNSHGRGHRFDTCRAHTVSPGQSVEEPLPTPPAVLGGNGVVTNSTPIRGHHYEGDGCCPEGFSPSLDFVELNKRETASPRPAATSASSQAVKSASRSGNRCPWRFSPTEAEACPALAAICSQPARPRSPMRLRCTGAHVIRLQSGCWDLKWSAGKATTSAQRVVERALAVPRPGGEDFQEVRVGWVGLRPLVGGPVGRLASCYPRPSTGHVWLAAQSGLSLAAGAARRRCGRYLRVTEGGQAS